jgi:type IV pilus assembly protein PilZ
MSEHREHPRAPIELRVDYKRLNTFFADYTKNISKGGTFIKTTKALPVGTRFLFRLFVPGRDGPFELSGEVIHGASVEQDQGMGIRFVWADPAARLGFEQMVEKLMVEALGPAVTQNLLRSSQK